MSKRTNTAQWEEKHQRWRVAVQKDGVRKQFYSSTPGRTAQAVNTVFLKLLGNGDF